MHAELHAIVDQVEAADPSQKPEAKALSNRVDALANKRLVEKRIRTDRSRGKVVSFEPLKGQLPESWGSA